MDENELSPVAVKAWCAELRRSKARVAFMRAELPLVRAQSGEAVATSLRAELEMLDLHATILESWISTAGTAFGYGDRLNAPWQTDRAS